MTKQEKIADGLLGYLSEEIRKGIETYLYDHLSSKEKPYTVNWEFEGDIGLKLNFKPAKEEK